MFCRSDTKIQLLCRQAYKYKLTSKEESSLKNEKLDEKEFKRKVKSHISGLFKIMKRKTAGFFFLNSGRVPLKFTNAINKESRLFHRMGKV